MNKTRILKIDPLNLQEDYLKEAGDFIKRGKLVIIPTETVYGIAVNSLDKEAVKRLYQIKQRPIEKPFSLHLSDKKQIKEFATDIPLYAYKLIYKFMPGPITLVLKAKDKTKNIGIRIPDNDIALKIISYAEVPIFCPSANISGRPAPQKFSDAIKDLEGLVDLAIDAGDTRIGKESTVVDCTDEEPKILREGAIDKKLLENIRKIKTVLFVCTGNSCRSVMAGALLEKKIREQNRQDIEVLTAGILGLAGLGATEEVKEILAREEIDVSSHSSRQVTWDMLNQSDLILVMEKIHEEKILEMAPEVKNRVFLLKEFAQIKDNNLDIPDPIGKSREVYEEIFLIIKEAIERVSKII